MHEEHPRLVPSPADDRQSSTVTPPRRRLIGTFTATWVDSAPRVLGHLLLLASVVSFLGAVGLKRTPIYPALSLIFNWMTVPVGGSLVSAILLFVWGQTALRRKRLAMVVAIGYEFINMLAVVIVVASDILLADVADPHLTPMHYVLLGLRCVLSLAIVILLVLARAAFPGRLVRGAWLQALLTLVGGLSLVMGAGIIILTPIRHLHRYHDSLITYEERVRWVLQRIFGNEVMSLFGDRVDGGPLWLGPIISIMAAAVLLAALVIFLRSARRTPNPGDDLRVRSLLLDDDSDSLGYFATRRDRLTVFSPDGKAAISFGQTMGVALAAGAPIGERSSWDGAITAWLEECRLYGWVPAVISVNEEGARAYKDLGMVARRMGDEAIIDTRRFDLRAQRAVAKAVRRVRGQGVTIDVRRLSDIPSDELETLRQACALWRVGDERGFSMALDRTLDEVDVREIVVTAHDTEGALQAVLGFSPWGMRGASLDVMRRNPQSVNGVVEAMVAALIAEGAAMGVDWVSLNFAMFRSIFEDGLAVDASIQARILSKIMRGASRFWQLEQLYESNAKYSPQWTPRYLCMESTAQFAQVALAAGILEGFVPVPSAYLRRHTPVTPWMTGPDYAAKVAEQLTGYVRERMPRRKLTADETHRNSTLERLREQGGDPYPVGVEPGLNPRDAREQIRQWVDEVGVDAATRVGNGERDAATERLLRVEGRVGLMRSFGSLLFAEMTDGEDRLQVMLDASQSGEELSRWMSDVDRGDLLVVSGRACLTRSGELTLAVTSWTMLAKTLSGLPRPRPTAAGERSVPLGQGASRTAMLVSSPQAMDVLRQRSHVVSSLRSTLNKRAFHEVETPILQAVHGGANARPFITHLNAYNADVYLRIAPELFLKRLAVAGMEAVYEIGRNFRNEGVDATHNPEFTSLEAYQAHGDYMTMRRLTQELIQEAARAVHGEAIALRPAGSPGTEGAPWVCTRGGVDYVGVDISGEWPVISVHDAVSRAVGRQVTPDTSVEELLEIVTEHGCEAPPAAGHGELIGLLYDEFVEATTLTPTFYTDFPVETSPLTRQHRRDPRLAERWDLVAWGMELGTAYSELTDPVEQRERFTAQSLRAAAGDPEAMSLDEDFLRSLELGLVPTGGLGLGVDRIAMLVTGAESIREVIAFPYARPQH